jgi:hypothetical protein
MWKPSIEGDQPSDRQIERPALGSHLNVTPHRMDRDPALGLMAGYPGVGAERHEHHPEIVVLDESLRVLTLSPVGFLVELLDFPREIEFKIRSRHRLWVRSPVLLLRVERIRHDVLPVRCRSIQ